MSDVLVSRMPYPVQDQLKNFGGTCAHIHIQVRLKNFSGTCLHIHIYTLETPTAAKVLASPCDLVGYDPTPVKTLSTLVAQSLLSQ